jgi:hypothetical protein
VNEPSGVLPRFVRIVDSSVWIGESLDQLMRASYSMCMRLARANGFEYPERLTFMYSRTEFELDDHLRILSGSVKSI